MNKIRGIQITSEYPAVMTQPGRRIDITYVKNPKSITVDCKLGSLVITPDELISYLEKRECNLRGENDNELPR